MTDKIQQWLLANAYGEIYREETLGGGCINAVSRIHLADGRSLILKQNPNAGNNMFAAEAAGLSALGAADALRVPEIICTEQQFLLLGDLGQGRPGSDYWEQLGIGLAKLHSTPQPQFGFAMDNYCGSTPQINSLTADGHAFFADNRIRNLARSALKRELLEHDDMQALEFIAANLSRWIPSQPPALIHGDLWSGNIHCDAHGVAALIDPAAYYGWAEAELAMTELFGGFNKRFYDSYEAHSTIDTSWRERTALYNLYHLLNHLLLFGGSYLSQIRIVTARFASN